MEKDANYYIDKLNLSAHPEGGFFYEVYRSEELIPESALPKRFKAPRAFSTSIYFLLKGHQISVFHRLKSDEIWHFLKGSGGKIHMISPAGKLITEKIGDDLDNNEKLQVVIQKDHWFAAEVNNPDGFLLVSCTVAPGFDFHDFEMAERQELLKKYKDLEEVITKFSWVAPKS